MHIRWTSTLLIIFVGAALSGCFLSDDPQEDWCCDDGVCNPCDSDDRYEPASDGRADLPDRGAESDAQRPGEGGDGDSRSSAPQCGSDYDCDWGDRCSGGVCTPPLGGECRYDSECELGELCEDGFCVSEEEFCVSDWECGPGCVCEDNACVPEIVCTPATGCPDGLECSDEGACFTAADTTPPAACDYDYECPGEQRCRSGACTELGPADLADPSDGADGSGGDGASEDGPTSEGTVCGTNADCSVDDICVDGECLEAFGDTCISDGQCGHEQACIDGICCVAPDEPATSGAGSYCEPGVACGGLEVCVDECYGDRCCLIVCSCDESIGTLSCRLSCT